MTAVLNSNSSFSSSYFGPLNFLDTQVAFDSIFPNLTPLSVTVSSTGASINSLLLPALLDKFIDCCKFHLIFLPFFRSDYVGTFARDDAASLQATVSAIKMILQVKQRTLS